MSFASLFSPSSSTHSPEYRQSSAACNDLLRELAAFLARQSGRRERPNVLCPTLEQAIRDATERLTETRPNHDFVVHDGNQEPPIFDGTVANATPPPLTGNLTRGHGVGTVLHLACSVDNPLGLAFLMSLGADATSTHTAFRRLVMHEAACNGSIECLRLLLETGTERARARNRRNQPGPSTPQQNNSLLSLPFLPRRTENSGLPRHPAPIEHFFEDDDDMMEDDEEPNEEPAKMDFIALLHLFRDLAARVQRRELSELDAGRYMMENAKLSKASSSSLARACGGSILGSAALRPLADGHGNTPLHWAAFKNETECVKLLLEYGADVNARAHPSGWTPLHDAAYSNSKECIGLLVEAGGRVNARANSGATPLCFAAQEDAAEAALLLLEYGADLKTRCAGGPVRNDNTIANGVNPHHPHSRFSGYTPLHYCAHYNAHRAARVVLRHDAEISNLAMEMPDLSERLPIHVAVARGSAQVLRELLHAGAHVETTGTPPERPLRRRRHPPMPESPRTPQRSQSPTTVSSPVLRSMIPSQPVTSSKPWNCLSQDDIDTCRDLIGQAEAPWSKERHALFTPSDRRAVAEILKIGLRLEQRDGIFVDLWPQVLQFCGRGWFEVAPTAPAVVADSGMEDSSSFVDYMVESDDDLALPQL